MSEVVGRNRRTKDDEVWSFMKTGLDVAHVTVFTWVKGRSSTENPIRQALHNVTSGIVLSIERVSAVY